jgi:hypothetical protein
MSIGWQACAHAPFYVGLQMLYVTGGAAWADVDVKANLGDSIVWAVPQRRWLHLPRVVERCAQRLRRRRRL